MSRSFAWSFSALKSYEQCPKKHYHTRVKKDFKEEWGEATNYGWDVHKALENRMKAGTKLPMGMRHLEFIVEKIEKSPGELMTEQRLALNRDFRPTGYFDSDVWVRGQVDVGKLLGNRAVIFDYKTGKRKEEYSQLDLMSLMLMAHEPDVDRCTAAFIWIKDKRVDSKNYNRADMPELWNTLLPRANRLELAHKTDDWPAKQSGLCKRYCPVTTCAYHGG